MLAAAGVEVVCLHEEQRRRDEHDRLQVLRTAASCPGRERTYDELTRAAAPGAADARALPQHFPAHHAERVCRLQGQRRAGRADAAQLPAHLLRGTFFRDGKVCEICTAGKPWAGVQHRCYRGSLAGSTAVAWMLKRNWDRGTFQTLVDVYMALSEFAAERFAREGLPRERIVIKPNSWIRPARRAPAAAATSCSPARLSEEKGVRTLLEAWRAAPRRAAQGRWATGRCSARCVRIADAPRTCPSSSSGMQPREEVLDLIGRAELQVITSECFEGFPLVLVESYARGTPVVASKIGSLGELVVPGETGLPLRGRQPGLAGRAGARASGRIRSCAHVLRAGARRRFEAEYTPARNLERLLSIYDSVRRRAQGRPVGQAA